MKLASLVAAILAPICIIAGYLLIPVARRMDGQVLPDGRVAIFSPTAGYWIVNWGLLAGLSLFVLAAVLSLLSRRSGNRGRHVT